MRTNGSAVDHLDVALARRRNGVHQHVPHPGLSPSREAIVAGGARTISLRQVAPWCARSQHPEDAVQYTTVINPRHASRLVRQERLDRTPLEVGQIISAHADVESDHDAFRKPRVGSQPVAEMEFAPVQNLADRQMPIMRLRTRWMLENLR